MKPLPTIAQSRSLPEASPFGGARSVGAQWHGAGELRRATGGQPSHDREPVAAPPEASAPSAPDTPAPAAPEGRVARVLRVLATPLKQAFIFAADLTPYLSVFVVTLLIGKHYQAREAVGFNLAYSYAATVLAIFAAPGMLSIKRKAATTRALGTILTAGFLIRTVGVGLGGAAVTAYFASTPVLRPLLPVWLLVFAARFFETATDLTLIISQYNLPAWKHLAIRVSAMLLLFGALLAAQLLVHRFLYVLVGYVLAAATLFVLSLAAVRSFLKPSGNLRAEIRAQLLEIRALFVAVVLFVLSTRFHVVVIGEYIGRDQAAEFATVQNFANVAGLLASAFSGLFFWSRNRLGDIPPELQLASLKRWCLAAIPFGLAVGVVLALAAERIAFRRLNIGVEARALNWVICLSTPLLAAQSLLSNFLLLVKRDKQMLFQATTVSLLGVALLVALISRYAMVGAGISLVLTPLLSVLVGAVLIRRQGFHAHSART